MSAINSIRQNRYDQLGQRDLVANAVDLLKDIRAHAEQISALAIAIESRMRPWEGKEPEVCITLRLAEVLSDLAGEFQLNILLEDCLSVMQKKAA